MKALFVTRHDISVFTAANGNIDNDKLLPFINQAQDIHIQNYLGSELYVKIQNDITATPPTLVDPYLSLLNDYIKPMLLHWSMVEYLPFAGVNIANGGIYTKNPENSTALSRDDVDSLVERSRTTAQFYTNRFIDYMTNNAAGLIPEYYSNSQEDMYPDDVANFGGWTL
jgi:hypothetical protein|tara:strand:+ start:9652 stop:10158 length:507 start_codon:yes stop_codon:yes gene_type:complete